eukprot:14736_1
MPSLLHKLMLVVALSAPFAFAAESKKQPVKHNRLKFNLKLLLKDDLSFAELGTFGSPDHVLRLWKQNTPGKYVMLFQGNGVSAKLSHQEIFAYIFETGQKGYNKPEYGKPVFLTYDDQVFKFGIPEKSKAKFVEFQFVNHPHKTRALRIGAGLVEHSVNQELKEARK